MTEIGNLLQTALDASLAAERVYSYWKQKTETSGEASEYIVYTLNGDANEVFSDDTPLVKDATATIRYYYHDSLLDTYAGRQQVKGRAEVILQSLLAAGLTCPNGYFDAGDIDDSGYFAMIFEVEYWRVV